MNKVPLQLCIDELSDFEPTHDLVVELDWDKMRERVRQGAWYQAQDRAMDAVDNALKDNEF